MSKSAISRAVAAGRLLRVYPRVYAVGHRALSIEGALAAALFHLGPGAALSHTTAAWWWGLIDTEPRTFHLSAPRRHSNPVGNFGHRANGYRGQRGTGRVLRIHQPRRLERVFHRGFPVTPVPRTLLDVASILPFRLLRRALAEADYKNLMDLGEVEALLGRGRPGSAALRSALRGHRPELARTRSELEERFLELCERFHLPAPDINAALCGFLVDALWRDARVVVELDGDAAHGSPRAVANDRHRELTLREAGYGVVRYSWSQVTGQPARVAQDLSQALDQTYAGDDR